MRPPAGKPAVRSAVARERRIDVRLIMIPPEPTTSPACEQSPKPVVSISTAGMDDLATTSGARTVELE